MKTLLLIFLTCTSLLAQQPAMREFSNSDGKKLSASIIGFDGDSVGLMLSKGSIVYYPLAKLSTEDQMLLSSHPMRKLPKVNFSFEAPYPIRDQKDKLVYIDRTGRVKFSARWKNVAHYNGEHARVSFSDSDRGVNGFVDVKGKSVLRSKAGWMFVGQFEDDLILVSDPSSAKKGFVSHKGKIVHKLRYYDAHRMINGVAWVKKSPPGGAQSHWTLMDQQGEVLYMLPVEGKLIDTDFSSGMCRVLLDSADPSSQVYLDSKGELVLSKHPFGMVIPAYHDGYAVHNNAIYNRQGLATLSKDSGFTLVSKRVTEGVVVATQDRYHYIIAAHDGKVITQLPFGVKPCSEVSSGGLIRYTQKGEPRKYGFLNRCGSMVIAPSFLSAQPCVNGYIPARLDNFKTNAVVNHLGKVVFKAIK